MSNLGLPATQRAAGTDPAAVYDPETSQMDVFVVNTANNLVFIAQTPNAHTPVQNLGGAVFATPAVTSPARGQIVVVVKGTGGVIYEKMTQMGRMERLD